MQAITKFFTDDHKRLDNIFEAFESQRATDLDKAAETFREFEVGLLRHIGWEEDLLFPAFEDKTGMADSGPSAVMRMEHTSIKELFGQIKAALSAKDAEVIEQSVNALVEVLHEHNNKEEQILYPMTDQLLDDQEKEQLLAATEN